MQVYQSVRSARLVIRQASSRHVAYHFKAIVVLQVYSHILQHLVIQRVCTVKLQTHTLIYYISWL